MTDKKEKYEQLLIDIKALIEGEDDMISKMSTVSCEVFHAFDHLNWVGFYRRTGETTLKVGPYQGGHGCLVIDFSRGVCGKCAREKETQIVEDVTKLPYHIACSSDTRSEIVLPVIKSGELVAVFDIDSPVPSAFDGTDREYLEKIVDTVIMNY